MKCYSERQQLYKKHDSDAGLDIFTYESTVIPARSSVILSTGLYLAIPYGMVGIIKSRSGLSVKHKLEVGAGVIDSSYRGEVMVHMYNHSDVDYHVNSGDKIAQLITIKVELGRYENVESKGELDTTERGEKGFGSTGL